MTQHLLRRFRKEIRGRDDIRPNAHVVLCDDPVREGNTRAARLLLQDVFGERIDIASGPDGLVCGSREEAAIGRLRHYTRSEVNDQDVLLSSLLLDEIHEYLHSKGQQHELFLPASPEQRFVQALGDEFEDVLYGL